MTPDQRDRERARKIYNEAVNYYAKNHKLGPYKKEWTKQEIIILRFSQALAEVRAQEREKAANVAEKFEVKPKDEFNSSLTKKNIAKAIRDRWNI